MRNLAAYCVHLYTATGVCFALLAVVEIVKRTPDPRLVFLWLLCALFVDATDGVFARWAEVKRYAAAIDGRTIDDLVDYLTFTFVPLLLVWRMEWLAGPKLVLVAVAMLASLFGFANSHAKLEGQGFFLGFPSYWNIFAFYAGISAQHGGHLLNSMLLIACAVLTVVPVRFIYPTLAPAGWRLPVLVGAAAWALALVAMLPNYPHAPLWLVTVSLAYPIFYSVASYVAARRSPLPQ